MQSHGTFQCSYMLYNLMFNKYLIYNCCLSLMKNSLSVRNVGGFGAQWFSSLVQVHLLLLLFLLTLYICTVIVDAVTFLSFYWLTTSSWCTLFFSVCSSYTQGTLLYQVFDPWCIYVSSFVGFTITFLLFFYLQTCINPIRECAWKNSPMCNFF